MVKKAAEATPNKLLRQARQERGWTQKTVADGVGAPLDNMVTRWERGTAFPSAYYIEKLCKLFGKTPAELGLLPQQEPADNTSKLGEMASTPAELVPERPWNVPFNRNLLFTGRMRLLENLHEHLNRNRSVALNQPQALTGLGGIGKTQTAVEYAYRYRDAYQAVFWVRAASRETLIADFVSLARLLALPGQDSQDQMLIVATVKHWLERQKGWLLILDNADDLQLAKSFLPTEGTGHILLTTRAQATGTIAESLSVEKLDTVEGILLLLRRAKLLSPDAPLDDVSQTLYSQAQAIVKELDGLPLALDQAGAYIEESSCHLSEYRMLYQRRWAMLLKRPSMVSADYPHTVASTWSLSFQQLGQVNQAATELLRVCAFLDPDIIPEAMLSQGAGELGAVLEETLSDPFLLNEAIQDLRRYSLIKRDPEIKVLNVHRLVQVVLKDSLDETTQQLWAERTVRAVSRAFPAVTFDSWDFCELCLPHVQACAALIDYHGFAFPEAARLLHNAGWYLFERGLYTQAKPFMERALTLREQTLGLEHPETASTLHALARLYLNQGRYEQAEPPLKRALAIREQALGPQHPDTIDIFNDLGVVYYLRGQYEQAEAVLNRALAIFEQSSDREQTCFADTLNNLAMLYQWQGKYEQAESLDQQALTIYRRVLGPEHHYTLLALNNLAYLYHFRGQYEQAGQLYRQVLDVQERMLGAEHPNVAVTLNDLASLYRDEGKYEQAEALGQRSLAICEQVFGSQHPNTASTLDTLASLHAHRGQYEQAETCYRQALAIREQVFGSDHAYIAATLNNLARLYEERGQYELALPLLERALSIRERVLDPEHPDTLAMRQHYNELLTQKVKAP